MHGATGSGERNVVIPFAPDQITVSGDFHMGSAASINDVNEIMPLANALNQYAEGNANCSDKTRELMLQLTDSLLSTAEKSLGQEQLVEEMNVAQLLRRLADELEESRNHEAFIESEEIHSINLMLFEFIDMLSEAAEAELKEALDPIVQTDDFCPHIHDDEGNTLLLKAVECSCFHLIPYFLDKGVPPNQRNNKGLSCLSALFLPQNDCRRVLSEQRRSMAFWKEARTH